MQTFEKITVEKVKAFQWLGGFTHPDIAPLLIYNTMKAIIPTNQKMYQRQPDEAQYHIDIIEGAETTDLGCYETDFVIEDINILDWLLFDENNNFIKSMSDEEFKKQYKERR